MSISLHHALVPQWLQLIGGLEKMLAKADAFIAEGERNEKDIMEARLAPDMFDFANQVKSARVHSIGAIEGVRAGSFSPDRSEAPRDFAGLRAMLAETRDKLAALDPKEIDGFVGKPMEFRMGDYVAPYDAEEFLLSFSQPNFYFHTTAAYAILRNLGVGVGKMDYLGSVRKKPS